MIDSRTLIFAYVVQGLVASAALLALTFSLMYARVRFEHTAEGRHKMREHLFIAGICGTTVLGQFHVLPLGVLVGVALVFAAALNGELLNLIRLFRKAQREHDQKEG